MKNLSNLIAEHSGIIKHFLNQTKFNSLNQWYNIFLSLTEEDLKDEPNYYTINLDYLIEVNNGIFYEARIFNHKRKIFCILTVISLFTAR